MPAPVARLGFDALGKLLWVAYYTPGNSLRPTMSALSATVGKGPPRRLFAEFVRGISLFLFRMERLKLGHEEEIDALLDVPQQERLADLLQSRGAMLVMPHTNASLPMVRGLSQRFSVLMLVKTTKDRKRSASQHQYYENIGCEILDVRRAGEAAVARTVIKALRNRRIVVVTGDLIKKPPPPEDPIDKARDLVRAEAFGQPVGAPGWPARFAVRADARLIPVMIEQAADRIVLHLGPAVEGGDVLTATRDWVGGMSDLLARYPSDWTFAFDRRWSELLQAAAASRRFEAKAFSDGVRT